MRRASTAAVCAQRFTDVQRWARDRGFELRRRYSDDDSRGRRGWPLTWYTPAGEFEYFAVADLADVKSVVTEALATRNARQPGEWCLHWDVNSFYERHPEYEPWCPWRRWIRAYVKEGGRGGWAREPDGYDPTIYKNPEEAVAASGLLGLEFSGRLMLSADVFHLSGEKTIMPTPDNDKGTIDYLVLLCVAQTWKAGYHMPNDPALLARRVGSITGLAETDGEAAVTRLITEGRLLQCQCRVRDASSGEPKLADALEVWAPESEWFR